MDVDRTTVAQFRLLVAVTRAGGRFDAADEGALLRLLGRRAVGVARKLHGPIDVDLELALLSDEERRRSYQSAFALAHTEGAALPVELELLRSMFPDEAEHARLERIFADAPPLASPDDAGEAPSMSDAVSRHACLSAVAGAMPLPGLGVIADLAVVALQTYLVGRIARRAGHPLDGRAAAAFGVAAAGPGGLRIAVNNLARFVPGWGTAFGAASSFVATWALGEVSHAYVDSGLALGEEDCQRLFGEARFRARAAFRHKQSEVEAAVDAHARTLEGLADRLERGEVSRGAFHAAVGALGAMPR